MPRPLHEPDTRSPTKTRNIAFPLEGKSIPAPPAARQKSPPKPLTAATIVDVDKSPALFPDGSGRALDDKISS